MSHISEIAEAATKALNFLETIEWNDPASENEAADVMQDLAQALDLDDEDDKDF
jgi:hypothetical protein